MEIRRFSTKPNTKLEFDLDGIKPPISWGLNSSEGDLSYDNSTDKFIFEPHKDFSGIVNININFNNGEILPIEIHVVNVFKPRARIIKIIGQELISNDVIALVELIKNSFDADATKIEINLNNIFNANGEITISDNGSGMTYEKIINVWLEPATPDKKSDNNNKFSQCFGRRFLGEKGIGRFAVHRLGNNIELVSRASTDCGKTLSDYETVVNIDWNEFSEDKYLDEIPIRVTKRIPVTFKNNSGTFIRITSIAPWKNLKSVRDAIIKIRSLESPIKPKKVILHSLPERIDPGIEIEINSNDDQLDRDIKAIKSLKELLKTSFYKFDAIVNFDGTIEYDYTFDRIDYQGIKRMPEKMVKKDDLKKYDIDWFSEHPLTSTNSPGSFEVQFYAWDLDSTALKIAGLSDYYRNIIKPNAGIRIYRDNFRVWPYGEPDEDWLNLDLKRLNAPTERSVSRNQVFGIIHISSIENPELKDQSNREGLIVSEQYDHFHHLVSAALAVFARERKADKVKIDKVVKQSNIDDIVTETVNDLKRSVEKNNHQALYLKDIEKVEQSYKQRVNDILDRYMMAAAIGISYSLPIHEMKLRLNSIKNIIEDLEKNPQLQDMYLRQLSTYVKETDDIIHAVTSIMSRQRLQQVDLINVAKNIEVLKGSDLKKFAIEFNIVYPNSNADFKVNAVPGLLNTAVLNIVDNSIHWLRVKAHQSYSHNESFSPTINIEFEITSDSKKLIRIRDNGTGFEDPFELLTEPYYSRKSDGLGLGLYLVKEIVKRMNGDLVGYNENGAVIEIIF